jgi:hypothetical protein
VIDFKDVYLRVLKHQPSDTKSKETTNYHGPAFKVLESEDKIEQSKVRDKSVAEKDGQDVISIEEEEEVAGGKQEQAFSVEEHKTYRVLFVGFVFCIDHCRLRKDASD